MIGVLLLLEIYSLFGLKIVVASRMMVCSVGK